MLIVQHFRFVFRWNLLDTFSTCFVVRSSYFNIQRFTTSAVERKKLEPSDIHSMSIFFLRIQEATFSAWSDPREKANKIKLETAVFVLQVWLLPGLTWLKQVELIFPVGSESKCLQHTKSLKFLRINVLIRILFLIAPLKSLLSPTPLLHRYVTQWIWVKRIDLVYSHISAKLSYKFFMC